MLHSIPKLLITFSVSHSNSSSIVIQTSQRSGCNVFFSLVLKYLIKNSQENFQICKKSASVGDKYVDSRRGCYE